MGKRGPGKTPSAILKGRGTFRADRHHDDADIELGPSLPEPPIHFTADQVEVWNAVGSKLAARGLMTELDSQAFELLVSAYCGMLSAQEEWSRSDLIVYVGETMVPMANPLVGIIAKQTALLKWCLTQFGATPSARTGINPAKKHEKSVDPMAALLAGNVSTSPPKPTRRKKA